MRKAKILYKDIFAGILTETNDGEYVFEYEEDYIRNYPKQFISFSMSVTNQKYTENKLFPFDEG
ncbi:MAG: hypothetical protein DRI86_10830 [Bacteroidetes bacterium]|nr:MAG: hypothetical protein DRI86_10830 [Bacteroidota bacterium]